MNEETRRETHKNKNQCFTCKEYVSDLFTIWTEGKTYCRNCFGINPEFKKSYPFTAMFEEFYNSFLLFSVGDPIGFDNFYKKVRSEFISLEARNTAQQGMQLTALRRRLAVSIFINVVLLAVVLFTIGGN